MAPKVGSMTENGIPNLLYIGDVPVESSYHGSALLYRLLETYPAGRLEIMEAGSSASLPHRRLPGVRYSFFGLPLARLQTTRLAPFYTNACLAAASYRTGAFEEVVRRFRPQALVTVADGYSWISAASLAARLAMPLHLICHDEWARTGGIANGPQRWKDRVFGRHYRAAASRLCVSPFMAQSYEGRYGVKGSVLYPSRSAHALRYDSPPASLRSDPRPFTCAFAGSIYPYVVSSLKALAACLVQINGRLLIYGPLSEAKAHSYGLNSANIELCGLLPSRELMEALRDRVHTLFVPMSFEAGTRDNMEISFPSKLTDYTAVGLPLLIHGPSYCSAVLWAWENDAVAEVVTSEDDAALLAAVLRLANHPEHRNKLANKALEIGDVYFSHTAALKVFLDHVGFPLDQASKQFDPIVRSVALVHELKS
jgi:hypothetical protein